MNEYVLEIINAIEAMSESLASSIEAMRELSRNSLVATSAIAISGIGSTLFISLRNNKHQMKMKQHDNQRKFLLDKKESFENVLRSYSQVTTLGGEDEHFKKFKEYCFVIYPYLKDENAREDFNKIYGYIINDLSKKEVNEIMRKYIYKNIQEINEELNRPKKEIDPQ